MAKNSIDNPELHIGARVVCDTGTTYTRIARHNRSDWIDNHGHQFSSIPSTYSIDYQPEKPDYEAGFKATPLLSKRDKGFGIVAADELIPGDRVYGIGFETEISHGIQSIRLVGPRKRPRILAVGQTGRTFYPANAVYIARNLGINPSGYTRWDA